MLEAAFDPAVGNTIELYAVTGLARAADVTDVANLSTAPQRVMHKKLVADATKCPTLGVSLVSDANFGATQITRFLTLAALLP